MQPLQKELCFPASLPHRAPSAARSGTGQNLLCLLLWSVFVTLVLHQYVLACHVIYGASMSPNINDGDTVFVNLLAPRFRALQRGEIVLVNDGFKETATKRVIGLPRENVEIKGGRVYIDGAMLREPYLPRYVATLSARKSFTLGAEEYFVMGDNRYESYDSRQYGPLPRHAIKGSISSASQVLPWTHEHSATDGAKNGS
jgi:signal peptidase I